MMAIVVRGDALDPASLEKAFGQVRTKQQILYTCIGECHMCAPLDNDAGGCNPHNHTIMQAHCETHMTQVAFSTTRFVTMLARWKSWRRWYPPSAAC